MNLVSATEGNRVKDDKGNVHSMTLTKPVPQNSKSTDIKVRLYGSTQTEDRKREQFKQCAETLKTLLMESGAMFTSVATTALYTREPDFKKRVGRDEVWRIFGSFPRHVQIADQFVGRDFQGHVESIRLRPSHVNHHSSHDIKEGH